MDVNYELYKMQYIGFRVQNYGKILILHRWQDTILPNKGSIVIRYSEFVEYQFEFVLRSKACIH